MRLFKFVFSIFSFSAYKHLIDFFEKKKSFQGNLLAWLINSSKTFLLELSKTMSNWHSGIVLEEDKIMFAGGLFPCHLLLFHGATGTVIYLIQVILSKL